MVKIFVTQRAQRRRKVSPRLLTVLFGLLFSLSVASTPESSEEIQTVYDIKQILRSILLIYTDDPLDPEVEEFINYQPPVIWEDNAYVYLWGMNKVTDNPYATGKEILEKIVEEDNLYNYELHPLDVSFLDDYPTIELPEDDLLCKKSDKDCIENILNHSNKTASLVHQNEFLITRYQDFLKFNEFKQIAERRMESPIPSYRPLTVAQKILHLQLLNQIRDNSESETLKQIVYELRDLKRHLKNIDHLLGKMVVASLINENLELFNYLLQQANLNIHKNMLLELSVPLTENERSIYNAMYEEHSKMLKSMYDWTSNVRRIIKPKKNRLQHTQKIIDILYFLVSKPNLTVNTLYYSYIKELLEMTKKDPVTYYQYSKQATRSINYDPIRNFLVNDSFSGTIPQYTPYQMRLYDLDMKLQLLRLLIQSESIDHLKKGKEFLSSYDQTEPYFEDGKLCYSGVAKMFPEFRCINIY